jgi:hypothetical protein
LSKFDKNIAIDLTLDDMNLNKNEKLVYIKLIRLHNQAKGYAYPSYKTLKIVLSTTRDDTVSNTLKSLEEKVYIEREIVPGRNTKYYLLKNITTTKSEGATKNEGTTKSEGCTTTKNEGTPLRKTKDNRVNIELSNRVNIYSDIVDRFNSTCNGLSKVIKITDKRKKAIELRLKEYDQEAIYKAFDMVSDNKFLNGENKRGWKADFDWIINPNNFVKILEGNYKNQEQQITEKPKEEFNAFSTEVRL